MPGTSAAGVVADLTTAEGAQAVVAAALELGGGLDVLVNNAGMVSTAAGGDYLEGDLLGTPPQRWAASLARNLDTAYLTTRAALPHLRSSGHGRVVMVTSVTGAAMAMRGEVAYAAAKAGLVGLTRALAVDEAPHGLTVNAVAPGWIATGSQTPAEALEGRTTPVGRSGTAAGGGRRRAVPREPRARPTSTARCCSSTVATRSPRSASSADPADPGGRRGRSATRERSCRQAVGRLPGRRRAHEVRRGARLPVGRRGWAGELVGRWLRRTTHG